MGFSMPKRVCLGPPGPDSKPPEIHTIKTSGSVTKQEYQRSKILKSRSVKQPPKSKTEKTLSSKPNTYKKWKN
jgi:hypothetical protein